MPALILRFAMLALAATVTACQSQSPIPNQTEPQAATPEPQFVRPLVVEEFASTRLLLVYDEARLLTAVRDAPISNAPENIWWQPVPGDAHTIVLGWIGGVCSLDATLTVELSESTVSLAIFDGHPRPLPSSVACPAVGIAYRAGLVFAEPISRFDFEVTLTEEPVTN